MFIYLASQVTDWSTCVLMTVVNTESLDTPCDLSSNKFSPFASCLDKMNV